MEHWFYFKSNGKKRYSEDVHEKLEKTINSKKYGFDERGVMVYQWTISTDSNIHSASSWKYFSSPEDGARMTKGWFKVVAPNEDNTFRSEEFSSGDTFAQTHADDEDEKWYYADGHGELYAGEIKKIRGKYYAFRPDDGEKGAAMLTGLVLMKVDTNTGDIESVLGEDLDNDDLEDIVYDQKYDYELIPDGYSLYYFGNNEDTDGAMKTGSITITLDGDRYNFYFTKSGGSESRGKGVSGVDNNKYIYMYGCRIKADRNDKYQVVEVLDENGSTSGDLTINASTAKVTKIKSYELRTGSYSRSTSLKNSDNEYVKYVSTAAFDGCWLVNTSGAVVKSKTAAKDGDDWYFYVNEREIKMYTNNKTLKKTELADIDWKNEDVN